MAVKRARGRDKSKPWVLGVSASHNGAACLLHGDEIVVAIQEERLLRHKRAGIYGAFGNLAIRYCLEAAGITPDDLSLAVVCATRNNGIAENNLALNVALHSSSGRVKTASVGHHAGHAVGVFAASGFEDAAVLVIDGAGSNLADFTEADKACIVDDYAPWVRRGQEVRERSSIFTASGTTVRPLEKHVAVTGKPAGKSMHHFAGLGSIFASIAQHVFGETLEAGKVMGLAPYGKPIFPPSDFFTIVDGTFRFSDKIPRSFTQKETWPANQREYSDLAASAQVALEEAVLHLARRARKLTGADRLCYTGGVALNSVTNERIIREVGFKDVFIMPAAEDSGNAIGAAYYGLWQLTKKNGRKPLVHDAVGASYSPKRIEQAIKSMPAVRRVRSDDTIERTVDLLCEGKIIAWFQGRSELGPRSLGQRSILCDPRRADAKDVLNARVKHREGFRPFAPVIPLEDVRDWFDLEGSPAESPFMLRVCKFLPAKAPLVPGVVHVDGTGRIQTLTKKANGPLYELVRAFKKRTGVPILLNTSLNVAGEPIVETPEDALWCMLYTGIDHCVLGDQIVTKKASYKSLLDLYPYVKATGVSIDLPVLDGQLRRELSAFAPQELSGSWPPRSHAAAAETKLTSQWLAEGLAQTRIHAETEWGPVVHVMTAAILRVLANCTGALDGKTLAERFPFTLDGHSSQTSYLRILGTLRRASVVGFSEKPLPRSR